MPSPTSDSPAPAAGPHDPHDHSGHDHPPTGADVVRALIKGLSIVTLVLPALAVVLLLAVLPFAPASPLVLLLGIALGGLQLISLVATSIFVSRTRAQLAVNPGLVAVRSVVEEVLRLAAVMLAVLLWPLDAGGDLAVWVGTGAALVWIALATAQTVSTRRRISRPSDWSKEAVATMLGARLSVTRSMVMRVLDVVGTTTFQLGATVLVMLSPVLMLGTIVLSIATGLSTLVLQRHAPARRAASPWAFAPLGIGLLTLALSGLGLATL